MTRKGDWIQTYTGRKFWPLDPRPEDVEIDDIAHALAMLCRFGGHCRRFYSVAEHSIYVSEQCGEHALEGLLHDAAEAYLVDVPRPIKRCMPAYEAIERELQLTISVAFGLPAAAPAIVKQVDRQILTDERLEIMSPAPEAWTSEQPALGVKIGGWPPSTAKVIFLERFHRLSRARA